MCRERFFLYMASQPGRHLLLSAAATCNAHVYSRARLLDAAACCCAQSRMMELYNVRKVRETLRTDGVRQLVQELSEDGRPSNTSNHDDDELYQSITSRK